jgi:hypothetical protein
MSTACVKTRVRSHATLNDQAKRPSCLIGRQIKAR